HSSSQEEVVVPDSDKHQISRRGFIKGTAAAIGGLIGALVGIPSLAYLLSPATQAKVDSDTIGLGPLENYPVGIPTRVDFTRTKVNGWERTALNYGLFVVRKSESEVRVFSDVCTHLGCRVNWHSDVQHYISPCHDGHFDILGKNVSGPPPRPLDEFNTKIENGILFVTLPPFKRSA
ncbi:MAG TPA: ubiquinol-cytochrome c reductase iron-sulfur subunit, partial [Anaerolineales bacterium]|nr:ubiquinol-cytochrome c reductase iron-sulfur subunit [Anaerolineales bacterium]